MRPLSALLIFTLLTFALLAAILASGILMGAGNAAAWGVAPLSMVFVIGLTFFGERACFARPASEPLTSVATKPRLHWLDNAKATLITMVVVGHSAMPFIGQGAFLSLKPAPLSWYTATALTGTALLKPLVVPLFFFISGYFSVSGLARKGPGAFLRDSFWRLGPAYFLFWLVVNPLNSLFGFALASPSDGAFSYFPDSAATWFLSWLLVFQSIWSLVDRPLPPMEPPSFGRLVLLSLGVAAVQLVASLMCALAGATLGFGSMPMAGPGGDGFLNALGFVGGLLAKCHDWLARPPPPSLVRPARWYVGVCAVLVALFFFLTLAPGAPGNGFAGSGGFTPCFFALQLPLGPYCACVLVLALDVFQRRANFETRLTKFLAGGAFGVYLLQYWAVTGFTYVYVLLLEQASDADIVFVNSTTSSSPVSDGELFGGFFFVAACSVIASFLVGGALKLVPGLSRVL